MHTNNISAIVLAKNLVYHERSKYIDTRYHFIRDHVHNKEVELHYVKSQDQVADIFTKALAAGNFTRMRDMIGLIEGRKLGLKEDVGR